MMSFRLFKELSRAPQRRHSLLDGEYEIYDNPNLNISKHALRIKKHSQKVMQGTLLSQVRVSLLPIHKGETIIEVTERLKWRNHCDATILDALVRKISKQTSGAWAIPNEYVDKIVLFPSTIYETEHGDKIAYLNGTKELKKLRYLYPIEDPINRNDAYVATLI